MTHQTMRTCCRCLKQTDGIHTCTPSDGWRKMEEQRDELLAILEQINKSPCNAASVAALSREGIDIVKGGAA